MAVIEPLTRRLRVAGPFSLERIATVALLLAIAAFLIVALALPLGLLLGQSLENKAGDFVGLINFSAYFSNSSLLASIGNSLLIAVLSTVITVGLAFMVAYGLVRSCMPGKAILRGIMLAPLLAPSLLPAIALVYLFGKQGWLRNLLGEYSIYGPIGIVIGEVFYCFPHALMILVTAMSISDARLFEAARTLRASRFRILLTVTLPGIKYGLISAIFVVFTLVITDFGVPKVIGGNYNVLATDVYKQVIGQQNFQMGAVVSIILLLPAILAFGVDQIVRRRQTALLSVRAVPYRAKPDSMRDGLLLTVCVAVAGLILLILGMAFYASLVQLWPYNLDISLRHYDFDNMDGGGWRAYWNSLIMSGLTAVFGAALVFVGAYLTEKARPPGWLASGFHFLAMLPMAVPGMVLGLGYIFFFNNPQNPLNGLYHTLAILVICTVAHFYTVAHLTAATALRQIDREFEAVSASLKVPLVVTFFRVTVPLCLPAIFDISVYLFVNAMTTVSAVVFIYSAQTALASVAVLNMDDAGEIAGAAAMAMMIVFTSAAIRTLHGVLTGGLLRRSRAWMA
ncbi:MAG: putative 2-aminoethylphosphonate ABC transporter permease subunit [Ferrovibrio sp.]|uniref:putative 2-aminoethylphosphonate ABC transporter permease subunit n=1 Tax=Ferrovibrio sp. TaxID=1917215 RepID=UPI00391CC8BF